MPRIPAARIDDPLGGPLPSPRLAMAESLAVAQVAGAASDLAGEFLTRLVEADRKRIYSEAVATASAGLSELQLQIERDPALANVPAARKAWAEGSQAIIAAGAQNIKTQEVLDLYQSKTTELSQVKGISVNRNAYGRWKDAGRASLLQRVDQYETQIAGAGTELEREELTKQRNQDVLLSDEILTPVEQFQLLQRSQARIAKADAEAEKEAKRIQAAEFARLGSDLEIAVSRGVAGEAEIEAAFDAGIITAAKRTALTKEVDRQLEEGLETRAELGLVLQAIDGSATLDPKNTDHKNAVDTYYDLVAPQISTLPPELQNEAKAQLSAQIGIIPAAVRGEIRGALRSGSDTQAAQAADLYDRLREKNIATLEDFSQEDVDLAITAQVLTRAGIDPLEAVRDTRERMKRTEQEQEIRNRTYQQDVRDAPTLEYLEDELGSFFRFDAEVPAAMAGELEFVARESFLRTGNLEAARESGLEVLKSTWGVTTIGPKRWQKYAPEVVYRNQAGTDWIQDQLIEEVAGKALQDPEKPLGERLTLQADLLTAREAQPAYTVMLTNEDGVPEAMRDASGVPLRWRPDWATSSEKARQDEEAAAELEKGIEAAHEARRFRIENPHLFSGETQLGISAVVPRAEGP